MLQFHPEADKLNAVSDLESRFRKWRKRGGKTLTIRPSEATISDR